MSSRRGAIVGAFVLVGFLLFATGLFLIGDRRLLFAEQFELTSTFGKVTGLQIGTPVRLSGIAAGEVLEIQVPPRPSERFRVRMRLREDLRQLVRADSAVTIQTDGIVGNAFIQISVGSEEASVVSPGDTIVGTDPLEFADLIAEGRDTFRTVAAEIIDLKDDVALATQALTGTAQSATQVVDEVGRGVRELTATSTGVVEGFEGTLADARAIMTDVRAGQGTIGKLLADDEFYQRMVGTTREAEQTMRNVREMTDRTREVVESFAAPDGTVQQLALRLGGALNEVQEATSDLAEGTEALKRNFLFRGFFRDRGFFDLDTVSREAYVSGALERNRTALRIWLDAAMLFERDQAGVQRLTNSGRRRIDSAMADLVRYPRDSPLVIEGYAEPTDGEAAFLVSADRAQIVRDYLLRRFRRQATLTDIMPMSDEAPGSPRGDDRWSGVSLALFVSNDALGQPGQTAAQP